MAYIRLTRPKVYRFGLRDKQKETKETKKKEKRKKVVIKPVV